MNFKKILVLFVGALVVNMIHAQRNPKIEAYIDKYKSIAQSEMRRTGVPACITLAQGILESGIGESDLAKRSNNHFGIKCKENWQGAKTYHDDDEKGECFRAYNTVEESYIDHSDFLKNRPYYKALFTLPKDDYKAWAYGLRKAGYATQKNYPTLLISLIERYNLNDYTKEVLNMPSSNIKSIHSSSIRSSSVTEIKDLPKTESVQISLFSRKNINTHEIQSLLKQEKQIVDKYTQQSQSGVLEKPDTSAKVSYPEGFFRINGAKVFYAPEGLSLFAFAVNRNLSYSNLLAINDLGNVDVLPKGRLIYLEKRKKVGARERYTTSVAGETIRDIALKEGVQLESLVKYNGIAADIPIAAHQEIALREPLSISKVVVLN